MPPGRARRGLVAACLAAGLLAMLGLPAPARGQVLPPPTGRSGEPPPFEGEVPRPPPSPGEILPPAPAPPEREQQLLPLERVFVREVRIVGNTVLPRDELVRVAAPYVNRVVTSEDLEALRVALTRLYIDRGYINSGAILPDQTVADGVITYQIIEGTLTGVTVEGNRWFRSGYLQDRITLGAGPPLNVNDLQERLQLLLEDSRIQRLNAELRPGLRPGEASLNVLVQERVPYKLWVGMDNYQSASVGAERGIVTIEHDNVTGNGDVFTIRYGKSEGLDPLLDIRYALPFTRWDTTVIAQYRRNDFAVVDEAFALLEIKSDSEIVGVTLRQPVYRSVNTELSLELTGERLRNQTYLLGDKFTLTPGARNGESVVAALRTAQELVYRSQTQVVAARSRVSVGLDALGATIHDNTRVPDARFFAWLGQFQWVRRLPLLDSTVIFRTDGQLANRPLLSLEQFVVGGRYTVRGYRENTLVRDNGVVASIEARVPLVRGRRWAEHLELAPFADYGHAWSTRPSDPDHQSISSIGIGLRWAVTLPTYLPLRPQLEVYWGHPLRTDIQTGRGDLQDSGVHFQFLIEAF